MILDDLVAFEKMMEYNYRRATLIEVYPIGYRVIKNSLDKKNQAILDNFDLMFGTRVVVVNDNKDFRFDQARVTYDDGDIRIINVLEESIPFRKDLI